MILPLAVSSDLFVVHSVLYPGCLGFGRGFFIERAASTYLCHIRLSIFKRIACTIQDASHHLISIGSMHPSHARQYTFIYTLRFTRGTSSPTLSFHRELADRTILYLEFIALYTPFTSIVEEGGRVPQGGQARRKASVDEQNGGRANLCKVAVVECVPVVAIYLGSESCHLGHHLSYLVHRRFNFRSR